jgi:hypothetical protein
MAAATPPTPSDHALADDEFRAAHHPGAVGKRSREEGDLDLPGAVIERDQQGATDVNPLVELRSSSYDHAEHGKIHTPKTPIVGWSA